MDNEIILKEWVENVVEAYDKAIAENPHIKQIKMTRPRIETIYKSVLHGNHHSTACRSAGLNSSTLTTWKTKAKDNIEPYKTFCDGLDVMDALSEEFYQGVIHETAMNGGWTAAAWKLERTYPDKYARKERMDLTTDKDIKIEIKGVKSNYEMEDDEKELLREE